MLATSTCLLIGPSGLLRGIDLLEVAVNRKPDIGLADRRAGRLHVVDFDDEWCRHRVAQEFIKGPIGTGEFLERGTLSVGSLAVDEPRRRLDVIVCPPASRPSLRTFVNTGFWSWGGSIFAWPAKQAARMKVGISMAVWLGRSEGSGIEDKFARGGVDSKEESTSALPIYRHGLDIDGRSEQTRCQDASLRRSRATRSGGVIVARLDLRGSLGVGWMRPRHPDRGDISRRRECQCDGRRDRPGCFRGQDALGRRPGQYDRHGRPARPFRRRRARESP